MSGRSPSRSLSDETLQAHQRLRRHAIALASVSASFTTEAQVVTDRYAEALTEGTTEAWTGFVAAATSLKTHAESVGSIMPFSPLERAAYDYFAQIVRENDDLSGSDTIASN